MESPVFLICVCAVYSVSSLPTKIQNFKSLTPENIKSHGKSPVEVISFMRQYGYLGNQDTNALLTEKSVRKAVKEMQLFGGLNQTGEFDNDTLKLLSTPRCGVKDVLTDVRQKRYAIGGDGWRKTTVSFNVANWHPNLGEQITKKDVRKAFDIWGKYSRLRFVERDLYDADIRISFPPQRHHDGFPFDGQGGVLAHAFYPYMNGDYGGDIHFDSDEPWTPQRKEGVNFYDVALHEIGHSLGLGHSHISDSVMFAYYHGGRESDNLSDDDIRAMYDLYVSRRPDEEDDQDWYNQVDEGQDGVTPRKAATQFQTTTPWKPLTNPSGDQGGVPNLCEGSYDAIGLYRTEAFVFKGEYLWRFSRRNVLHKGYPIKFRIFFYQLPNWVTKIDATYERPDDNLVVLFTGNVYWVHDGNTLVGNSPQPLTNLGLPSYLTKINGAMVWGENLQTYLFSKTEYWKLNETTRHVVEGYPRSLENWGRVPLNFDTVETFNEGETYFFKGRDVYLFDDKKLRVADGYPVSPPGYFFGCH